MRRTAIFLFLLAAAGFAGCQRAPSDSAATAAPPAAKSPVGPVPGPGAATAPLRNPYGDDANALQNGRILFVRYNCSGCHGGRAGGGMGPSLRDEDWLYGGSDADVFDSIAQGRGMGMPAWGTRIPEAQIWQLVAYVKSLRTPREPNPPG
jgi:cytochrome c oxidase cbb3-type subunit 3